MATTKNLNSYPQKYFLEGEACKYFGIKQRTYKRWIDNKTIISVRFKCEGTNYYVIEPAAFDTWYSANILEQATNKNKFHNRKPKQNSSGVVSPTSKNNGTSALSLSNGGLSRRGNLGVMGAQVIDRKEISA